LNNILKDNMKILLLMTALVALTYGAASMVEVSGFKTADQLLNEIQSDYDNIYSIVFFKRDDTNFELTQSNKKLLEDLRRVADAKAPKIEKADDLTPQQVKAYRLADNKLNESKWDMGLAIEELKGLYQDGFDITLTGFDKDLLIEPDDKDDIIPENAPTIAKLGDLWALGRHRVMCGDSTDKESVARLMDGKKADMYLTDPPYNVDYTGKTKEALKIENDKKEDATFVQFLTDAFVAVDSVMKNGSVFYIWHADMQKRLYYSLIDPQ
jgi:hypothetical protein